MPELPEVQTTVNGIQKYATGLCITDTWTDYKSSFYDGKDDIKNPVYFRKFRRNIIGAKITGASRRGKNVLIGLSNGTTILIHMKMTGHIMYGTYTFSKKQKEWVATRSGPLRDDPFNRFIHFVLVFSNGNHIVLSDMRKFAKVTLVDTAGLAQSKHLAQQGPEPLEKNFGINELISAVMRKPRGIIKTVLMNHEVVSGIGNIYSDEILWRAGIHPLSHVQAIPRTKWPLVLKAIKEILSHGINFGGDSLSDYRNILGERGRFQGRHTAYRKTGKPCSKPRCTGTISRMKLGNRSAHFCDKHQKLYT